MTHTGRTAEAGAMTVRLALVRSGLEDAAGEPLRGAGLYHERGERGASCARQRDIGQPRGRSCEVHCGGNQQMEQAVFANPI